MTYLLEGNIAVKAALHSPYRQVNEILVDERKRSRDLSYIIQLAKKQNVPVSYLSRDQIDKLASGTTHGGCLAKCQERTFQTLSDLNQQETLFLALIEGVEDPFNFGYILRNLYAAGCHGVLIPKRNWTSAATVISKSSAGASEYLPLIIMENPKQMMQELKDKNISLICAERKDACSLYEYTFPKRICIAIGGEMRGLSKIVKDASNQNVFIPYCQEFRNALTASSASAIFAFEWVRQMQIHHNK